MRDNWITLREAAALSGLSPKTIYELCRLCVVRARTERALWHVHRGDVALLVLQQFTEPRPQPARRSPRPARLRHTMPT